VHEFLHPGVIGRRPGRDRPADRVHGRDAEPVRVSGRPGVPGRLLGQVRHVQPRPVRDLRLRGDATRAQHDQEPRRAGNSKSAILAALFADHSIQSVLGTYGFDANGDTTLKSYGLYKVASNGDPVFFQTVTPTKTVT